MFRPATLVAVAMGFLIAFVLGQVGLSQLAPNMPATSPSMAGSATEAVVRAFYEQVNAQLESGSGSLDTVTTSEFVDHDLESGAELNRDDLLAQLASIHATALDVQLAVTAVEISGGIASVRLSAETGHSVLPGAWTVSLGGQMALREVLRIQDGRVAERWAADDHWPVEIWTTEQQLPVGVGQLRQPSVQGFSLDPKATIDILARDSVVLAGERGSLRVEPSGVDAAGTSHPLTEAVEPGQLRIVRPENGTLRVTNLGDTAATFWTTGLDLLPVPRGPNELTVSPGISQLARVSVAAPLPDDDVRLVTTLVSLPPGAELAGDSSDVQAVVVLDRMLEGESNAGLTFYCIDASRSRLLAGIERAERGQGFAAQGDGSVRYRVTSAEPATVLLLTIAPILEDSTPVAGSNPGDVGQ